MFSTTKIGLKFAWILHEDQSLQCGLFFVAPPPCHFNVCGDYIWETFKKFTFLSDQLVILCFIRVWENLVKKVQENLSIVMLTRKLENVLIYKW